MKRYITLYAQLGRVASLSCAIRVVNTPAIFSAGEGVVAENINKLKIRAMSVVSMDPVDLKEKVYQCG